MDIFFLNWSATTLIYDSIDSLWVTMIQLNVIGKFYILGITENELIFIEFI